MANPRALVNALYTHWDTVEVLVRLSRKHVFFTEEQLLGQVARVRPGLDVDERAEVVRNLLSTDIVQPLVRSSDLQLNSAVLEFVRSLTHEHELGLSEVLRVRVQALRTATESINHGMASGEMDAVMGASRELGELVRQIMQQLEQDRHALLEIAEEAKSSDSRMPLERRYQRVNAAYDRYIEPMNQLMDTGREGMFYRYLEDAEKALDIAKETLVARNSLYSHRLQLRQVSHQLKELRKVGREVLQHCADTLLPLRDELRLHNSLTSAISTLLGQVRKRGLRRAMQPPRLSLELPLWHSSRNYRVHAGDEVRGWMADFRNYQPAAVVFPEDEASESQDIIEYVNDTAIRTQLLQKLPVTDLLYWLHEHHSHLQDATLLRLFHDFQHDPALTFVAARQDTKLELQTVRVSHFPHQVSTSHE